jgi:DNA-binding CsgD family transcriptional regulator
MVYHINMRRNINTIPKYLDVLAWRREGKTFQEIADLLGVSRQRAWEIHERAVNRIQDTMSRGNPHIKAKQAA